MQISDIFVLTPPGACEERLAIAACRAGARGILDLEFTTDVSLAKEALFRLGHFTSNPFGVKISPLIKPPLLDLITAASPQLAWVLLGGGELAELKAVVQQLRSTGRKLFFEATSLEEMLVAEKLALDGLILKGNEAQGRVGDESSFILLQRWHAHTAVSPKPLPAWVQGGVGLHTSAACIVAGASGVVLDSQVLLAYEAQLAESAQEVLKAFDGSETFYKDASLLFLGQDAAFAKGLAMRYVTVGGILQAVTLHCEQALVAACRELPLSENSSFSKSHSIRYPIVQGPMTRVSDTPEFAKALSQAGGLPILALAFLKGDETEKLLKQTKELLQGSSWGVGLLGFLPPEIGHAQLEAIFANPPPFAIIAGGRPDQAQELEQAGIATYLHVPSPGLLRRFLQSGSRRFVFEGRECGGHVGPRSSFVLWESMIEVILEHLGQSGRGEDLHLLFAGGIHDALSGAMVSAIAAPLAAKGVSVGVLMGTAYLFTKEAVVSGGIVPRFQEEVLGCTETVLLHTGPGHAIRCIKTPYCDAFNSEKQRLQSEGHSPEEITRALEWMNIGRLRVASKGVDRIEASKIAELSADEQYSRGMYMIGQLASLKSRVYTMPELHDEVSAGSCRMLKNKFKRIEKCERQEKPCDIAIIGMSCFYPGANSVQRYWTNIINRFNAVTEIPASHWDWRLYYDANPRAPDKIISKWGGFLDDITFDPLTYGITPKSLYSIEPMQLFLLEGVRLALADAGYKDRPFNRERTATILGVGGAGSPLAVSYGLRTCIPLFDSVPDMPVKASEILEKAAKMLPEWTEDAFPGILLNVAAGRVANRFNFGGTNYAIDAACGSSLAALYACVRELEMGDCDVAVAMGADTVQTPYSYMAFSKTHALSPRGKCAPFDHSADGIVLSEGIGVVILKRLEDAERDGDKIYAVIKGIGSSSDGKEKGLTAPATLGQLRALSRAYSKANISPSSVGLIEAHGTGTVVGDQTEVQSMSQILQQAGAATHSCALGSVKSMIGHSKCAAGIAGLIKVTLALHHKVLPPTIVERPNPKANFEKSPLYLNTEARPWTHRSNAPRTAGVSAFGFGGTNFHAVLEEYKGNYLSQEPSAMSEFPAELFLFRGKRDDLIGSVSECHSALADCTHLGELARGCWRRAKKDVTLPTLAIVAASVVDLKEKLVLSLENLRSTKEEWNDPRGIYFASKPRPEHDNKIAFLFPGQGSQYPNMLAQVAMAFPEVRQAFDLAEGVLDGHLEKPLGKFIFPPSTFTPEEEQLAKHLLSRTDVAQPSLGAASMGLFRLLTNFGIKPDYMAGHSYGEYVALAASGAYSETDLIRLSHLRGKVIIEETRTNLGGMVAIEANAEVVSKILLGLDDITIANDNSPAQTVISGTDSALIRAIDRLKENGMRCQRLAVSSGFHSPIVASAEKPLREVLEAFSMSSPTVTLFSNTTAACYSNDPSTYAESLAKHLVSPVRFREEILALYDAGARTFVEVGPQGVLTGLVGQTLAGLPHFAIASDLKGRSGIVQLQQMLAQLLVCGVPLSLDRLYQGRTLIEQHSLPLSPTTWVVNSARSRPIDAPEPHLMGQMRHVAHHAPKSSSSNEVDHMVLRFQDLMGRFLEMQKSVMTSYLQGSPVDVKEFNSQDFANLLAAAPIKEPEAPKFASAPFPSAPIVQKKPAEAMNGNTLTAKLLDLVSKRTGYPKEMLALDLNLEADLGVDSIKRVEILSDLADSLGSSDSKKPARFEMEKLTSIMTLGGIVDYLTTALAAAVETSLPVSQVKDENPELQIERCLVSLVEKPLPPRASPKLARGCLLFTDDGRGIAKELMGMLDMVGQKTALINSTDLTNPHEVDEKIKEIKKQVGPVSGLIHLLPIAAPNLSESWKERMHREIKSLYILARALESELCKEGEQTCLIAATSMGGKLGYGSQELPESFFPGHGGIAGFVKSLKHEWPEVLMRVIDLKSNERAVDVANCILSEMSIQEGPVEVGYSGSKRVTWEPVLTPLDREGMPQKLIGPESTILVTGGARGITASVCKELALRFRPNLILVGRSANQVEEEAADTASCTKPADIKAALISRLRRDGAAVKHGEVEGLYQKLLRDREIRDNLAAIRQAGAQVHYYNVDIRDDEAWGRLLDEIESRFGGIDGVIHGAGIVEDRLLRDKTPESFDRVFSTKVDSALTLIQHLRPERLKFCVFFASISSRFGNKGQSDYAAANEILSKLALYLDQKWPARIISVAWGPWSEVGMAKDLAKHLEARGLKMISPEEGSAMLVDELIYGKKGESEVVIAGGAEHAMQPKPVGVEV